MAKRKRLLKMTLSQQLAAMQQAAEILNGHSLPDVFQQFVDEVPLPFPIRGIQHLNTWKGFHGMDAAFDDRGVVFEARHSGRHILQQGTPFLAAFPFATGCFLVGHPESVNLDRAMIPYLQGLTRLLDLYCDSFLAKEESRKEIERLKAEVSSEAIWDELTLLPNAKLFPLMMSPMLAHARRSKDLAAVLFLEIGKLEEVSLMEGSEVSDKALKQILERMMQNLREGDIAVRAGKNRFCWSMGGLHSVEDTTTVAEKVLLSLIRPLDVEGKTYVFNGSIGISLFPSDGPDPETLMKNAEAALEVSRKTVGNSIRFFAKETNEKIRSYLLSRKELKDAAAKEEFSLHYQPLVLFGTDEMEALEALIRWPRRIGTTLYPQQFLPLSEQIGISGQLDEWTIRNAIQQRNTWEKEGLGALRVSANLSRHFFWESGLGRIQAIIREFRVDPDYLDLEIPEAFLLEEPEKAAEQLKQYRTLGVRLTIDDFGSAGGLLTSLNPYPAQSIKLAPQLIHAISAESTQASVVAFIVSLAHSVNIRVIAKAVETQAERTCLEALGCDAYQGNFFSPALPRKLLAEFLKRRQMKIVPTSVEKTQPMTHEDEVLEVVLHKTSTDERARPVFTISCIHCHQSYNALEAKWCACLTSDPTVVCPSCQRCFCRASLDYLHDIWGSAPEPFWDRRKKHEDEAGPPPLNPSLGSIQRPLVLVVDDEPFILKTAVRLIRGLGYAVIVGKDGRQGLQLAQHYMPDLVISDALMPKMDGYEMCTILKRDPATAKMKLVILTSFSGAAKYKANVIRDFHFDEHLQKPVEFDRLRAVLQKLL